MPSLKNTLTEPDIWSPLVAPNGKYASWISTKSGRPAVHVTSISGEKTQTLAREALPGHPFSCYCWMRDSRGIWLLHVPEDDLNRTELWGVSLTGEIISKTHLGGWSQLFGATERGVVICDWDRTNAESGNLYLIGPATGERQQLTDFNWLTPPQGVVNSDGRIAYTVPSGSGDTEEDLTGAAVIQDLDGAMTVLGEEIQPVAWSDDRLLLVDHSREENIGIWAPTGDINWIGSGTPFGFLTDDQILAVRDGTPIRLPSEEPLQWTYGPVTDGTADGGSATFVTEETETHPSRVVGWTSGKTTPLSAPEYPIPPANFSEPESVTFADTEKEDRDAWLLLPDECPAPCLIHLYGFAPERGDFGRKFGRPFQYLRNQGYAILQPAHGGSRFSERRHADFAAAANWAIEQEWSNGQVVALGHSSGSYDVLMQATHYSTQWEAGIAWNGITDLREYYETMAKSRVHIEQQLGDDGLNRLDELSPVTSPDTVHFPLLILSGEQDWMKEQLRDFVAAATAEGANVEYEEIAATGHWTRDLEKKVSIWNHIEDFLEETL
ncbi:prolyl oligopeptidase family serine peptidase [Halomontanus rarus]|uniref:prolyl oligopeptidase family serine peptidase n=1 Tax=Halomontanus rarus TaxID=3034020 RepID=UPI001A985ADB